MKTLLLFLASLLSLLTQAQTIVGYRASTLSSGQQVVMAIYADGSRKQVSTLPSDAAVARKGGQVRLPYAPEAKWVFTPEQFGTNKYYSPNFKFSLDWNPGGKSVPYRRAMGVNLFNTWAVQADQRANLQAGEGMIYLTESSLHGPLEGAGYFESSLADYEAYVFPRVPPCGYGDFANIKLVTFNLEQSNDWNRGNYAGNAHWPTWDAAKNRSVVCEFDGQTRTLEQIDQQGLWGIEAAVRRGNRRKVAMKAVRMRAAYPVKISDGSSMYQGLPRLDFAGLNNVFLNSSADVSHIGGSGGTITLNGRTYTGMNGSQYSEEDVMWGYYYLFSFDLSVQAYNDIFINQVVGKTNLPYLWSQLGRRHIVADEKGYLQLNRRLQQLNLGTTKPIVRMIEPMFEGRGYVPETGGFVDRLTWPELQPSATGDSEPPKVWQPPYFNYSRYIVTRFFAGDTDGWGFHMFPLGPNHVGQELNHANFNFHLHSITAIYQARNDMQPYETYFPGSTLVEDPEVQLNQTGNFSAYTGTEAYNYSDGTQGTQKPAYMLRYKPTSDGWRVLIMGGMNQDWTQERTDIIRVPGGGLNGNMFRVKLRGASAQVYEFIVKSSDSNQTYEALPAGNTSWERPAYGGRTKAN